MTGEMAWIVLLGVCFVFSRVGCYEIRAVTKPVIMAESPYWDDNTNTVIFVDVVGQLVLRYDPAHPTELKNISFSNHQGKVTPAVPVRGSDEILVGVGRELHLVDVDWGKPGVPAKVRSDITLDEVERSLPRNRFNDGKADRSGQLWIGTMDDIQTSRRRRRRSAAGLNKGQLFRFDFQRGPDGRSFVNTTVAVQDGLQIPNGMAWTEDDKVYYLADSAARAVFRFDFNGSALSNRTVAFNFADHGVPGAPDGMTLDKEGNLWIAVVHGGRVIRVDPRTGKLLQTIMMGVTNPSAAEWGGRNRDVLYVTTARYQMGKSQIDAEPCAGCMFQITGLGTRGYENVPFAVNKR